MVHEKELKVDSWVVDGFVGTLALVIYNFILYILTLFGIKGIIDQLEDTMGYFGLNTFLDLGFNPDTMVLGITMSFTFSFLLGIIIGNWVRMKKKYR